MRVHARIKRQLHPVLVLFTVRCKVRRVKVNKVVFYVLLPLRLDLMISLTAHNSSIIYYSLKTKVMLAVIDAWLRKAEQRKHQVAASCIVPKANGSVHRQRAETVQTDTQDSTTSRGSLYLLCLHVGTLHHLTRLPLGWWIWPHEFDV